MSFKLLLIIFATHFNYYFALFNIGNLNGNLFTIGILFGLSEVLGIMFGEPIVQMLPDWIGFQMSTFVALISNLML